MSAAAFGSLDAAFESLDQEPQCVNGELASKDGLDEQNVLTESCEQDASWADELNTRSHLSTARTLRDEAEGKLLLGSTLLPTDGDQSGLLQHTLRKRVAVSVDHTKSLMAHVECVEHHIQKVNSCTLHLQGEYTEMRTPYNVVRRRIMLREDRPSGECYQDAFQQALENEEQTLRNVLQQLTEHLQAGVTMRDALEGAKTELVKDAQSKRHAMRLERSCLIFDVFHGRDRACVLPPVAGNVEERPASPTKMATKLVKELVSKTRTLEEHAGLYCHESDKILRRSKLQADKANVATIASMKSQIARMLTLKKELAQEVAESQVVISKTEMSLDVMEKEIDRQVEIMANMDPNREVPLASFDQRLPHPVLEIMRDNAVARNQDTFKKVANNTQALREKCKNVKRTLDQLRASHETTVAKAASVTTAWSIDMACAKVRPSTTIGEPGRRRVRRPQRDRELPRLDEATMDLMRQKIKAASYTGHGRQLDVVFGRFDKDGSGELEENEVRLALRCSLKIPAHDNLGNPVITDLQIASLCAMLDRDGSGSVSISEIVAFVGSDTDEMYSKRTGRPLFKLAPLSLEDIEKSVDSQSKATLGSVRSQATPRRRRMRPLEPEVAERLRAKIKAASYAGHLGRELEQLLARFDKDGSGVLEDEEVRLALRRTLRISPSVITDAQITALCGMLDADNSGAISITEIVSFVGDEPVVSKRTGKSMRVTALDVPRSHLLST